MRKLKPIKRKIIPDSVYNSVLVTRLIIFIMKSGKKNLALKIVYGAFDNIKKDNKDPLEVYKKVLENLKPNVELKSKKVGGARYQVPTRVTAERQITLALRWLIDATRKRNEKTMIEKLTEELKLAFKKEGVAFKKKETVHKMADANKAFAYFSW